MEYNKLKVPQVRNSMRCIRQSHYVYTKKYINKPNMLIQS